MARLLRLEQPGAWYHITARGNERRPIYRIDADRRHFLELLAHWRDRFRCRLHAYVLMENHYHLLLETPEANLSRAMQWLNVSYTVWFNRRYQRSGHLLQGRFKALVVEPETWALGLSRYLHLNPVRVRRLGLDKGAQKQHRLGLGRAPSPELIQERLEKLRSYRWSSYRAYAGMERAPAWLQTESVLAFGGGRRRERFGRYRHYCEQAVREGLAEKPWEKVVGRLVLGSREFIEAIREKAGAKSGDKASEVRRVLAQRPDFDRVVRVIEDLKGEKWSQFRDRRGDWGRDLALQLGRELSGMTLAELSQAIGGSHPMTVSAALKRLNSRLERDRSLQKAATKARSTLLNI
jgi:REP element-mobilizing transposase RayT